MTLNLEKVDGNININRYDNGWMVEVSGEVEEDRKYRKIMCNTEEDVVAIIKEWNSLPLES
jgi:hypothetical protein|tara:strand:+ start:311 stop:493 length:183 start_codon:yes stop_codon:yes gene_type:complete